MAKEPENVLEEGNKARVSPFSKEDILAIVKEGILNGTITSEKQVLDNTKTYVLKVDKGELKLVEEVSSED